MSTSKKGFGAAGGFGGGKAASASGAKRVKKIPYKNPHPDPFEGLAEVPEDMESGAREEVEAIEKSYTGYVERAKKEAARFEYAVDADFWSGVCFRSRKDRQAFLEAVGMDQQLFRGRHMSGYELADRLGLDIQWQDHGK